MRPVIILAAARAHPRRLAALAVAAIFAANLAYGVVAPAAPAAAGPPADLATVDAWFEGQVRDAGIPGAALVVVGDGRIVHERGFGAADATGRPVTAGTPFVIGSLSKSITALAVMQLVEAGEVDLDASIARYLPSFTLADPAAGARITVRDLLTHTSGIPAAAGIAPLSAPATSLGDQVEALRDVVPAAPAGERFIYSNANYLVLGRLVEVVSGQPFGAYLSRRVFGPLGMAHATTDPGVAIADGLGQAHRLFFGLADAHAPLFREDLAPAGFIAASADDVGRFLLAQLGEAGPAGRVVSAESLAAMHEGVVATGLPGERMGMGWAASSLDGEPIVAHAGSTTDMAAIQVLVPGRRLGVAVLFDAQAVPYELLHKPDAIGLGVVSLLTGHAPGGTLAVFYPAFDAAVLVALALLLRSLVRAVRAARRGPALAAANVEVLRAQTAVAPVTAPLAGRTLAVARLAPAWSRIRRVGRLVAALYLDVVVPVVIVTQAPAVLGAGWPVLVHIDVGLVLLAVAMLRVATGFAHGAGWIAARRATALAARAGAGSPVPAAARGA